MAPRWPPRFPVRPGDDVMLVTDAGRLIRVPADQVRITGRQAMGVTLFRVDAGEHVTSVFPVVEDDTDDERRTGDGAGGTKRRWLSQRRSCVSACIPARSIR